MNRVLEKGLHFTVTVVACTYCRPFFCRNVGIRNKHICEGAPSWQLC